MPAAGRDRPTEAEGGLSARAAALCERAAAVVADPHLAEQLADVSRRLLGRADVAATAYEAGRLDERALRAPAGRRLRRLPGG